MEGVAWTLQLLSNTYLDPKRHLHVPVLPTPHIAQGRPSGQRGAAQKGGLEQCAALEGLGHGGASSDRGTYWTTTAASTRLLPFGYYQTTSNPRLLRDKQSCCAVSSSYCPKRD